jgi:hypothetical protein
VATESSPPPAPPMPGPPGSFPPAQPLPEAGPSQAAILLDWLLTLVALATAIALALGASHWALWVLAGVSIILLSVQFVRKLVHLHKGSVAPELPQGNRSRPPGTPKGRKLSKETADGDT